MTRQAAEQALAARAAAGNPLRLWLRDDDAVAPTPALDRLLGLTDRAAVPLTLAVIPMPWDQAPTGPDLARRLQDAPLARVALHGWSHRNHAPAGMKKRELGPDRPAEIVRTELREGLTLLRALHGARALPLLVPPWNRIDAAVVAGLSQDGFAALSTFGAERPLPGLGVVNTHLDLIDWHGSRSLRDPETLWAELATLAKSGRDFAGILTHHLVHDAAIWDFLGELMQTTKDSGAQWCDVAALCPPLQG